MATTATKTTDIQDIDLDAMLADLDLEEVEEPTKEEAKVEASTDELDELLGDLDIEEAAPSKDESLNLDELEALLEETPAPAKEASKPKAKAKPAKAAPKKDNSDLYAEDEVSEKIEAAPETKSDEVEANKKKASKTKPKEEESKEKPEDEKAEKKAAPKTGSRSVKVDSGLPASEQLKTKLGESGKNLLVIEDDVKLEDTVIDALPKKVKEKLHNLYMHLHNGVTLSTYTIRALDLIVENGEATTTELVANYQEKWSKGTSASQVGQIVRLFKDLKICEVEGKTLKPNKKSRLLPLLTKKEIEA